MATDHILWKIKKMFETTNQLEITRNNQKQLGFLWLHPEVPELVSKRLDSRHETSNVGEN
jgi:hypothetical protein